MNRALAATRATLTWIVITASLVAAGLITSVQANAAAVTYTASTSVNVRTGPSTSKPVLTQLQAGQTVLAAGSVSGDWLPIKYDNQTAYAWAEYLDKDAKAATVVTSGPAGKKTATVNVNVRTAASLDADIATILMKDTVIKVTGLASGDFTQTTVDGKTQWIYTKYLSTATDTTPDAVAQYKTTLQMALRETASVSAANLVTVPVETTVGGTGVSTGSFTQVIHKGKLGWLFTGFLAAAKGIPAEYVLPTATALHYVTESGVSVRSAADAEAAKLTTLDLGIKVAVTGKAKNNFSEVIWNARPAWIASIYLSATKPKPLDLGTDSLNKLEPYGKAAVLELREKFPQIKTIHGWRSSSAYSSDHPSGRAIDIMIPSYKTNKALGDAIADYVITHGTRLHVTYVIWRQRNYRITRGYWVKMEDRGSDTQNHMDHVHVSFDPS